VAPVVVLEVGGNQTIGLDGGGRDRRWYDEDENVVFKTNTDTDTTITMS
jgi:hypothetical protein